MELLYSILITIFIGIMLTLLINSTKSQKKLPPGPMKLPIIGNLHNMIGPLPHHTLRRLSQKYGPLMHLKLGESSTLVVSSAEIAREFMKTQDLCFAHRPKVIANEVSFGSFCSNITLAPYGDYWRQMRKLCVIELLSNTRVKSFCSIREEEVQRLVLSIRSRSFSGLPINLTESLLDLTSTITCRAAFGRKYDREDAVTLVSKFREAILLGGGFELADLYPSVKILRVLSPSLARIRTLFKNVDAVLQNIIDKHVLERRTVDADETSEVEDLVDVLLRMQKSDGLEVPITTNGIKAIIADIFGGGTDSTAKTLEWAMAEMIKHPKVMAKAQDEIRQAFKGKKIIKEADIQGLSYLKLVIKETLRLHPPSPLLLPRECREPCVIEGYEIPIKTRVLINAWAIGRDPKYWIEAESFYPERFANSNVDFKGINFEYIPFGAGRRICPGIAFGLANVELALSQLLHHFDWNLPDSLKPENLDMTENFGATVGRKLDLHLVAIPFVSSNE